MTDMHRIVCLLAATLLLGAAPARAELSQTGELLDRIVAVVNDGVVLQSELDYRIDAITANLAAQNIQIPPREVVAEQVLDRLVLNRIQLQRAERLGIDASDEEVNAALAEMAQRSGLSLSQLPQAMAMQGIDYGRYREDIREEFIIERLRRRDLSQRISVTREEVERLMEQQAGLDLEYEIQHLLIAVGRNATEDEVRDAYGRIQRLRQRLEAGEDFGRIAIAHSDAPNVLQTGGNLGWRKAEELPTLFAERVLRMTEGEITEPIRSPSGFHIVRLNASRGADKIMVQQRHARHILIQPNELISDEQALQRLRLLRDRIRDGEDFAAIAEAESDDKVSASRGGDLDWASPGTFVPPFEAALDRLEVGELSEPVRTPFGWHLIQLLETRDYDSTGDVRMQRAMAAIRARKLEEEGERWLQQLRDEAYVELRLGDGDDESSG